MFGSSRAVSASFHCGEPVPKTFVMSPEAAVPMFSSTMFAVATAPKLQPALVYGTHGAGAFGPVGVTMFGTVGGGRDDRIRPVAERARELVARLPLKRT